MFNFKIYQLCLLCYICLVVFLINFGDASDENLVQYRFKRYLGFNNISRFFHKPPQVRLNWKNNMVRWNQFFAEAIGYKLSYDDPPSSFHPYKHFQRREVFQQLEMLMDKIGVNGYHCMRRAVCEIKMVNESKAIYYRILKIIFRQPHLYGSKVSLCYGYHRMELREIPATPRHEPILEIFPFSVFFSIYTIIYRICDRQQSTATDRWHDISEEDCSISSAICPISVLDVSLFTDI